MLHFLAEGDILTSRHEALVNSVNCVGVMGRGVALAFRKVFPKNFEAYAEACKQNEVEPGKMFVFEVADHMPPLRYIINFPTKRHWRGKSRMEDLEAGLRALVREVREREIKSIAIPPLGAGLGGLEWEDVKAAMQSALADLKDVQVTVFEPNERWADKAANHSTKPPKMTVATATVIGLMKRYLAGMMDPEVSLLEIHKLLYFMQASGENLKLRYEQEMYGPYAKNLRHLLKKMEGHFTSGYKPSDNPGTVLKLVPGAASDAQSFLQEKPETRRRFERVAKLVEGFESSYGLELLSTVHWVVVENGVSTQEDEVVRAVHAWHERKREFTPRQIGIALRTLDEQGWLDAGAH